MLLIAEQDYQILQAFELYSIFLTVLVVILCRNHFIARFYEVILKKGKTVLQEDLDGTCRWTTKKIDMGYFIDKDEHTQIAARKVVKTNDGDIYIMTQGFGLSYSLDEVMAAQQLEKMGFMSLPQALNWFDDKYFSTPEGKKILEEAKASHEETKKLTDYEALELVRRTGPGMQVKNLALKNAVKDARTKLIRLDFEYLSPETIGIAINYRWGLQNQGSMNNRNIYEKGIIKTKQENQNQGWSQDKTWGYVFMLGALLLCGSIAFLILYSTGMFGSNTPPITNPPLPSATTLKNVTTTLVNLTKLP